MRLTKTLLLSVCLMLGVGQAQQGDEDAVFQRFVDSFMKNEAIPAERKQAATGAIAEAKEHDSPLTVSMALAMQALYPELSEAAAKASEGDGLEGLRQLYKLTRSKDAFLAAEANYVLGRTLFSQQRYEECLPYLENLSDKLANDTIRDGDILYYRGVAKANSLEKEAGIALLAQFLEDYPDASDRLRLSAQATLDGITGVLDGSVEDIADHMDFSHRRLGFEDSGEETQVVQQEIVAMLDKIIDQAEQQQQQQQQQQGQGQGQGQQQQQGQQQGQGQGDQPGGNASAQNDPKKVRDLRGAAKSAWDDLRKRDRETDALSGLKSKYPPRYRELVEQYFKDLQEGEDGGEEEND